MADLKSQIASRLRALRGNRSRDAFSEIIGLSHATIIRMEKGQIACLGLTALAIACLESKLDDGMKDVRKLTANTLKREREAMGLSKYKLARFLDVSAGTVSFWESGNLSSAPALFISYAIDQLKVELARNKALLEIKADDAANTLIEELLAA